MLKDFWICHNNLYLTNSQTGGEGLCLKNALILLSKAIISDARSSTDEKVIFMHLISGTYSFMWMKRHKIAIR